MFCCMQDPLQEAPLYLEDCTTRRKACFSVSHFSKFLQVYVLQVVARPLPGFALVHYTQGFPILDCGGR